MNLISGPHLAMRGYVGPSCQRGRREERGKGREDISRVSADCVVACRASMACHVNMVKLKEPRDKSGKYVDVILKLSNGLPPFIIIVKM